MRSTKRTFAGLLLVLAIVTVNVITVVHLVNYFGNRSDSSEYVSSDLSHVPDTMILHGENGVTFRSDTVHSGRIIDIATTNRDREVVGEYLTEYDPIDPSETGGMYLEYLFDTDRTFNIDLQFERRTVTAKRICFVLTGEYNGYFCIDTPDGVQTFGRLNPDLYLLEIVQDTFD